jgi:ATPase subunit of ABC transporter with duplicated ATPase domains
LKRTTAAGQQPAVLQDEDEEFDDSDSEYEDDDDVNEEESEEEGANNEQKQKETQMHTQSEAPSSSSLEAEALEKVKQDIRARAERLAHDLGLPFFAEPPSAQLSRQFEFLVEVAPHRVQVTQRKHAAPAKRYPPSHHRCLHSVPS